MSFLVPPTRTAAVVRQLRAEIITGQLPPGTLIKDAELSARLGVSITPIREAIAQLAVEGLIDIRPNRARHVIRMTQKTALELIDVMCVLSCAGFGWGVENLTGTHLDRMRQRHEEFLAALRVGNMVAVGAAAADFAAIVILASGNRELQSMRDLAVARTTRIVPMTVESDLWRIVAEGHADILRLLEAGDKPGATERYRKIFVEYRVLVEQAPFDT